MDAVIRLGEGYPFGLMPQIGGAAGPIGAIFLIVAIVWVYRGHPMNYWLLGVGLAITGFSALYSWRLWGNPAAALPFALIVTSLLIALISYRSSARIEREEYRRAAEAGSGLYVTSDSAERAWNFAQQAMLASVMGAIFAAAAPLFLALFLNR